MTDTDFRRRLEAIAKRDPEAARLLRELNGQRAAELPAAAREFPRYVVMDWTRATLEAGDIVSVSNGFEEVGGRVVQQLDDDAAMVEVVGVQLVAHRPSAAWASNLK